MSFGDIKIQPLEKQMRILATNHMLVFRGLR